MIYVLLQTKNGVDIPLKDRQDAYVNNHLYICEEDTILLNIIIQIKWLYAPV